MGVIADLIKAIEVHDKVRSKFEDLLFSAGLSWYRDYTHFELSPELLRMHGWSGKPLEFKGVMAMREDGFTGTIELIPIPRLHTGKPVAQAKTITPNNELKDLDVPSRSERK